MLIQIWIFEAKLAQIRMDPDPEHCPKLKIDTGPGGERGEDGGGAEECGGEAQTQGE